MRGFKNKFIFGLVLISAIIMISGMSIIAFASPGTQNDPFITLSYLNNIFRPHVMSEVRTTEQEMITRFESRIRELEAQVQSGSTGQVGSGQADRFHVVTLSRNQQLTASVGTEIMLRIGTATGFGTEPALVNYTTGSTLSSTTALTTNHMYLVTIEGNGIRATADTVRVLVRGAYTVR